MIFSEDFYKEEVRGEYTVTSERKKVWAVQLTLMELVLGLCRDLDLKVYAWGGTLLGAIRNQGFIPWDDNVDLAMPREDFEALSSVLHELCEGEYMYSYEYLRYPECAYSCKFYGKLSDRRTTCLYKSCNYNSVNGISISIHPLDVYCDETEADRNLPDILYKSRKTYIRRALTAYHRDDLEANSLGRASDDDNLASIRKFYFGKIDSLSGKTSDTYIMHHLWSPYKDMKFPMYDFKYVEEMDFEGLKVPVPVNYHNICCTLFDSTYTVPTRQEEIKSKVKYVDADIPWETYKNEHLINPYDNDAPLPVDLEFPEGFFEPFTAKCNCHPDYLVTKYKRRIHAVILDLLTKIDSICKENNIRYFIDGGTLLGAVRDQGIVYWDDDADIIMFREDYERFVEVAGDWLMSNENEGRFALHAGNSNSYKTFMNMDTTCVVSSTDWLQPRGICVDIFPVDKVPADKESRVKYYKELKKCPEYRSEEVSAKYDLTGPYYAIVTLSSADREWLRTDEYYADVTRLSLNGFEFDAPARYEECCEQQYGDTWRKHISGGSVHHTIDINPSIPASEYLKYMPDFRRLPFSIE